MKTPHLEIERKFLIRKMPRALEKFPNSVIEQGYLAANRGTQVRLRRAVRFFSLTYKKHGKEVREEREIRLTRAQFDVLWPATAGARLTKIRYRVPWKKWTIEIDVYLGSNEGLVVAEVEFPNLASCRGFRPPAWLGEEITGAARYSNIRLARD
ncbi:MAG: CYTH domain-containing protein [Chthoniobacterales bacterium]